MQPIFFQKNREKLIEALRGGIVIISAYGEMQRSADSAFRFEQEANFWYVTGIEYPNWRVVIDGMRRRSTLIMPAVDSVHALFDGQLSAEEALKISGCDDVIIQDDEELFLRDLAKKHSVVHAIGDMPYAEHYTFCFNPAPKKLWHQLERTFARVEDCRQDLARLRAIKQPEEITVMKKAARLTTTAFDLAHDKLSQFSTEYELEAEFTGYFRSRNGTHAYDPIVAAGKNACTLHYVENSAKLRNGQLILIDIGARIGGYAADVTRTYAYGKISSLHQAMHQALYLAQQTIIELIEPHLPLVEYQKRVDETMMDTLEALGLIRHGDLEGLRNYFPHAVSHGLGIDVHDSLGAPRALEEGMVLTVEPGIYVPKKGIGLRLEDDILVTAKGHQNLTASSSANVL